MNVLLTNTGRRTYFVDYLLELKKRFKNLEIHVSDSNKYCSTFSIQGIKKHLTVKASDKKYIKTIINIVKKNKINLLIPLTDYDLKILSKNTSKLDKLNCKTLVANPQLCETFENKILTEKFCLKTKILTPKIFDKKIVSAIIKKKKIEEKKINGSSSEGLKIFKKKSKMRIKKKYIYQEFIKGRELNFDILNNFEGKFISASIKEKILMRSGETDIAKILTENRYIKLAKKISKKIKHIGNVDCDAIEDAKGKIYFIDFNLRFGGGYPFTHHAGQNFIENIISIMKNKKIKVKRIKKKIILSKGISIHKF